MGIGRFSDMKYFYDRRLRKLSEALDQQFFVFPAVWIFQIKEDMVDELVF
jgi:hypothetical protein